MRWVWAFMLCYSVTACFHTKSEVKTDTVSARKIEETVKTKSPDIEVQGELIESPSFGQPQRIYHGRIKVHGGKVEAEKHEDTKEAKTEDKKGELEVNEPSMFTAIGALVAFLLIAGVAFWILKPKVSL